MTYDDYVKQKKQFGQWPLSKKQTYDDAKSIAVRDAARALGMKYETLRAMIND